ncbi:MAG: mechanosensitive ion channel family protein [Bacteroidetes bacterium]|nr:MAG: mechanosensitive ion channel family protein [Bacteroidota bacterium]
MIMAKNIVYKMSATAVILIFLLGFLPSLFALQPGSEPDTMPGIVFSEENRQSEVSVDQETELPLETREVATGNETKEMQEPVSPVAAPAKEPAEPAGEVSRLREELTQAPDVRNLISIGKIFWATIFILIGYFIFKALTGLLSVISERNARYKAGIRRILPIVKIAGWAFIFYIIINGIFQPPPETIFAFFASVGVAIGFASQDLLKNIFGGLMILFDKPFQIGDKIESGKYYGEVKEVGLRSTRVVTPDDSIVTIPNSEMMNQSISNANSSENNCQVVAEFFLPVTTDTRRVRQIATEAAQVSRYVYLKKPIFVEYTNVLVPKGSFLKMRLKAYVMDVRYEFPFQSEMTEIVLHELKKEGFLEGL